MVPPRRFAAGLLGAYLLWFAVLAVGPSNRAVWWAENLPILLIVGSLGVLWNRGIYFSRWAYGLMAVLVFLHTLGGHFTFERVPFGWVQEAFGFERNHFDRVAHFSVGFYAFAIEETLHRRKLVTRPWVAMAFGIFAIGTVAAVYEIIEWLYAVNDGGEAGTAFLGSQGDVWDAQKDMLCDIMGAVVVTAFWYVRDGRVGAFGEAAGASTGR